MEGATETDRRIMQGIMQGETLREIAEDLGISKDAAKKRLRKYGKI